MAQAMKYVDEKKFDYVKFERDLKKVNNEKKKNMVWVSEQVCLRSGSYLGNAIKDRRLPMNVVLAIANWAGMDLKNYEVKKSEVKEVPKKEEPVEESVGESGWSCVIKVDEEFGMAMMKVFKDGKEIALGRSYTYGHDDVGIVQGISYAAHMCYKVVQQNKMAMESIKKVEDEEELEDEQEDDGFTGRVVFKDWIKKYEKDNSKAGKLARYIASHYPHIPATGKKKIRMYIRLNKGETHLQTFDSLWQMYVDWYNTHIDNTITVGAAG